jgi:Cdc6-like AAA superfamily ATPase
MTDLVTEFRLAHPVAADLARYASPAVRIESSLLRDLRLALLPGSGPDIEADLWFSRLVRSRGPDGIALRPDVLERLRTDLRGDARAAEAWAIIEAAHAGGSPALVLEEQVAWLVISGAGEASVEQELHRALAALEGGSRPNLARWAANAWTRLPDAARDTTAGWLLGHAAGAGPLRVTAAPDGIGNLDVAALAGTRVPLGVRRDGAVLELGAVSGPGAAVIDVLDTEPRLVDVLHDDRRETVAVPSGALVRVEIGDDVRLVNALHEVYELTSPDIFARLRAAPPELGRAIIDFEPMVLQHTRDFVEREAAVAELNRLLDELPSGYVFINGPPGSGKTALLSHLVERRGDAHHFLPGPLGRAGFFANSCAQVIVRHGLPYPSLPPDATEGPGVLTRLLGEAASDGRRVVLLVDGIDQPSLHGMLPRALSRGVFVVATTRPGGASYLGTDSIIEIELGHDVAAVREFARRRLAGTDADPAAVAARSEGNFFVASMLVEQARAGDMSGGTPPGLSGYFEGLLDEVTSGDAEGAMALLLVLAAARSPVPIRELSERLGWNPEQLATAIRRVRPVLVVLRDAVALYLSSFAAFAREHLAPQHAPLDALWPTGSRPFLNRAVLKQAVRKMRDIGGPAVLVVNGPPGSGKSTTADYLRQVSSATGAFRVAQANARFDADPAALCRELAAHIGALDRMPAETAEPARYNALLGEWLLATVMASGETWWLVIDDLSAAPLGADVVDFVGRLATLTAGAPTPMRLVLLGWDAPLPAEVEPDVMREELGEIAIVDVREFLAEALAGAGQTLPEAELDMMARDLYLGSKPGDLRNLAFRVAEVYERITSNGPQDPA